MSDNPTTLESSTPEMGTFDDEGNYTPREVTVDDLGMSFADAIEGTMVAVEDGQDRLCCPLHIARAGRLVEDDVHHGSSGEHRRGLRNPDFCSLFCDLVKSSDPYPIRCVTLRGLKRFRDRGRPL